MGCFHPPPPQAAESSTSSCVPECLVLGLEERVESPLIDAGSVAETLEKVFANLTLRYVNDADKGRQEGVSPFPLLLIGVVRTQLRHSEELGPADRGVWKRRQERPTSPDVDGPCRLLRQQDCTAEPQT